MRIKEFLINRYGPLSYDAQVRLDNFNLLWGENEHGKTLTIDALIKLLLGKNVRDFVQIDRVEEYPSGHIIIEDNEGKEVKLPGSSDFTSIVGLSPTECRNIFVIRNSELMIESEGQFYTDITDRLTGLRTTEIKVLRQILLNLGKLTPGGNFRNTGDEKLKSRIDSANKTCESILALIEKVNKEELDSLEKNIVEKGEEIADIETKLQTLDEARKRERYKKGNDALEELERASHELEPLESFNDKDLQLWRGCENTIKNANTKNVEFTRRLKENEESQQSNVEKRQTKERELQIISKHKSQIDNDVKPILINYKKESEALAAREASHKFWNTTSILSAILFAVSLAVNIIEQAVPLYILTGFLLLVTVLAWAIRFRFQTTKSRLAKLLTSINLNLSKFELNSDSINGVLTNIQILEDKHTEMFNDLQEMKRDESVLADRIRKLRDEDIPQQEKEIIDSQIKVDNIMAISGLKALPEYTERLKSKQNCNISIAESRSILNSHFGKISDSLPENITQWQKEIRELEAYKDRSLQVNFDEDIVVDLKGKKTEVQNELRDLKSTMQLFQGELNEIEKNTQWILGIEAGDVPCSTTTDLASTYRELTKFIDENENNQENALNVLEILSEIENEEQKEVSKLFGKQSAITGHYRDITNGLYEEVLYNRQDGIQVRRQDGKLIESSRLSGGAYDQLYFSIRLALGDKILKGNPGFFIIDDPFLKADPERLRRQMVMLRNICGKGWQIVYFSAKGEVKDALADYIAQGIVNYFEINNASISG